MKQLNSALAALDAVRALGEPARRILRDVENMPAIVACRDLRARIAAQQPEIIPMPKEIAR